MLFEPPEETKSAYFLTVEWCRNGDRGVMCDREGRCFRKSDEPHTTLEMQDILGPFWIILDSKSMLFTEDQLGKFTYWVPLEEYSNQFGIAIIPSSLCLREDSMKETPVIPGKIQ